MDFYNLDMIIAVGYRVSSVRATKFRQWATLVLKKIVVRRPVTQRKMTAQAYYPHVFCFVEREMRSV